ncbi:PD-(D/E)XK nuclease family protein [candidate division WOR-3 bacterium]|nr:PD-(D/E)XK nuclease family protein [candidate division WOR-3 bacterium]
MNYKLSPSDLTFLYDGCRRCFWLKVRQGIVQPSIPLPGIFSKIAGLLKTHYSGMRTEKVHSALPPGIVKYGEKWVQSQPISFEDHEHTVYIKGRFDIVVEFDDKTYGVVDFKTGNPDEEKADLYSRQLHAYIYALEHPVPGAIGLSPITKLGLLYFYPNDTSQPSLEKLNYESDVHWVEIQRNDDTFKRFLETALAVLESDTPPALTPGCNWCGYAAKLAREKLI